MTFTEVEGDVPGQRQHTAYLANGMALSYNDDSGTLSVYCPACEREVVAYIGLEYGERAKRKAQEHQVAVHQEQVQQA